MKSGEALNLAASRLRQQGIYDPFNEAIVLLGHVLNLNRARLFAETERGLTAAEEARLEEMVVRRLDGAPAAYIVRQREFYGLDLYVDERVLVPRPETEILVEAVLEHVKQAGRQADYTWSIADVGTGSGAIAIALTKNLADCYIYGIDISPAALEVADINVKRHGLAGRITLLRGDLLEPLVCKVDIITANLPYIAAAELPTLQREVAEHEPDVALKGGCEGTNLILKLLQQAGSKLLPGDALFLEVGAGQAEEVSRQARLDFAGANVSTARDYSGVDRVVAIVI